MGFQHLSPEKQREIAGRGGKAAQAKGTAHRWNTVTAQEAVRARNPDNYYHRGFSMMSREQLQKVQERGRKSDMRWIRRIL
jgi:hypothetical protein